MAPKLQIEFVIKPDGTVEERVTGVNGPACEKITEIVERALGDVIKREQTPDYYNQPDTTEETVSTSH